MNVVRIEADYLLETPFDPRHVAEAMAGEQSSGTFIAVPGETPELKARAGARVERLEMLDEVPQPSLPHAAIPEGTQARWRRASVTLSWPFDNVGPSLPNLLSTVAGNLFELIQISGLRLIDLRLPDAFAARYPGPKFGIAGTRRLAGVASGPVIGTIIKPSVGLRAEETASLVKSLCEGGIDFIEQRFGTGRFRDFARSAELRASAVARMGRAIVASACTVTCAASVASFPQL